MAEKHALAVVQGNNKFTTKIYSLLRAEPGNVFFSPISLHTALSMLHQGSEGATLSALSTSLGLPDKTSSADGFELITNALNNQDGVTLEIANKLYVKTGYNFKSSFQDVIVKKFNAAVENVNFSANKEAAKSINSWVETKTHDKIKDLIDEGLLGDDTRSVIVNAIYFKGDWADKFDKANTRREPFFATPSDSVDVDMMHIKRKFDYKEVAELDAKVVRLPYKNPKLSMVVVLPNSQTGIGDLEKKLEEYDVSKLTEDMWKVEVNLAMPRFKIETKMTLNEPLKKAGLSNIFSDSCDLSGLLDSDERLFVSAVIQKAFIEVNEEGSEAAAATGIVVMTEMYCIPPPPEEVILNRPFVFALLCDSNVLFYGKMTSF